MEWKGIIGKGFTSQDFATYAARLTFSAWHPQFAVLHNTAKPKLSQWHSVSGEQRMKNLENFYQNNQKWSAGPHLFVADDLIWVFTSLTTPGVHSPSWNAVAWGVEMVGDYSVEAFDHRVRDNTVSALATLHALLNINPATLRLHKEDSKTRHDCPGKNVDKADMINRIDVYLRQQRAGEYLTEMENAG